MPLADNAHTQQERLKISHAVIRLRGKGLTEEQIIDLVAEVMAETLPERS